MRISCGHGDRSAFAAVCRSTSGPDCYLLQDVSAEPVVLVGVPRASGNGGNGPSVPAHSAGAYGCAVSAALCSRTDIRPFTRAARRPNSSRLGSSACDNCGQSPALISVVRPIQMPDRGRGPVRGCRPSPRMCGRGALGHRRIRGTRLYPTRAVASARPPLGFAQDIDESIVVILVDRAGARVAGAATLRSVSFVQSSTAIGCRLLANTAGALALVRARNSRDQIAVELVQRGAPGGAPSRRA